MKITPELSKKVGWEHRDVPWLSLHEVKTGTDEQIINWHRHLPRSETEEQRQILDAVYRRLTQ